MSKRFLLARWEIITNSNPQSHNAVIVVRNVTY
jgi:hypothetical protein